MRLHLEMTSLGQLVSDTVELYQAAAEARSIVLQRAPGGMRGCCWTSSA